MVFTSRFHCMGGIALSATVPYMKLHGCSICYNLYWLSLSGWNLSGGIGS